MFAVEFAVLTSLTSDSKRLDQSKREWKHAMHEVRRT